MTRAELAKRAGANLSYLANIQMGHRNVGIDTQQKLICGLEINCENSLKDTKQLSAETHQLARDAGIH